MILYIYILCHIVMYYIISGYVVMIILHIFYVCRQGVKPCPWELRPRMEPCGALTAFSAAKVPPVSVKTGLLR